MKSISFSPGRKLALTRHHSSWVAAPAGGAARDSLLKTFGVGGIAMTNLHWAVQHAGGAEFLARHQGIVTKPRCGGLGRKVHRGRIDRGRKLSPPRGKPRKLIRTPDCACVAQVGTASAGPAPTSTTSSRSEVSLHWRKAMRRGEGGLLTAVQDPTNKHDTRSGYSRAPAIQ